MIQARLPLIGAMLNIALISNFATVAHAAEAGESIWIEGEQTSDCNVPKAINLSHYAGHPYLSDGKWLRVQIPPGEGIKALPPEGLVLSYDFTAPAQGSYAVWNRIGYEFIRSPFSWRVDNGAWTEKKPNDLTIDLMLMEVWNEVAWLDCGRVELSKGKHRLDIQLKGWSKEEGGKPVEQQILYCSDAICLSTGTFRPNGKHAPGTAFQDEADQAAAKQVFALPSPAAGERAEVALKGAWQIARFDEQDVSRAERAHPILAAPPVDDLFWYAIQVPGDRNEMRKDFNYAHRYFYRTRVSVPTLEKISVTPFNPEVMSFSTEGISDAVSFIDGKELPDSSNIGVAEGPPVISPISIFPVLNAILSTLVLVGFSLVSIPGACGLLISDSGAS